jgi:hypothetical protein
VRVKRQKNTNKLIAAIKEATADILEGNALLFRGLSLTVLTLTLSFFIPVVNGNSCDNEFGPGIYTTDAFEYAMQYCPREGGIMVFKTPDLRGLTVWEPDVSEWNNLVATWLQIPMSGVTMPEKNRDADIILGPISSDKPEARKKKRFPKQDDRLQMVGVSYEGCRALANSLYAIIYIES